MGYFGLFWTNFNSYITNFLNMTDFFNKKHTLLFNYKFGTPAKKYPISDLFLCSFE